MKSRYRRVYGKPQTPYERVLASPHVTDDVKAAITHQHQALDPVMLKIQIEQKLKKIFLAWRRLSAARHATNAAYLSVRSNYELIRVLYNSLVIEARGLV